MGKLNLNVAILEWQNQEAFFPIIITGDPGARIQVQLWGGNKKMCTF